MPPSSERCRNTSKSSVSPKTFFAHFGQFSKRLSDFQHSYLRPMATKKLKPIYQNLVGYLLVIQKYFSFENFSCVVHCMLYFFGPPGIRNNKSVSYWNATLRFRYISCGIIFNVGRSLAMHETICNRTK